ncbi:cbb3-type cytochrome c oxidase N-terminal domain-containing protein [Niabella beijingensis]|uniref:cbb3-type cytochrome c oxidase N-terminal domain-containing protein n=1 Tax=Niabella beijingensis TaxID=2872700 RepID=UPI001CBEF042|nr:cbb3-type cytochrome c oxidase N-terminal domain-containing protein [Niabella beijingensis]MBZ4191061.1 c-type cytochrome [Niabella beijingensis]
MKEIKQIKKKMALVIPGAGSSLLAGAREQAAQTPRLVLDVNTVLIVVIVFLLLIIGMLGFTLRASMDVYKERKKEKERTGNNLKSLLLLLAVLGGMRAFAQEDAMPAIPHPFTEAHILRYILLGVTGLELLVIFAFIYWIRFFTGIEELRRNRTAVRKEKHKGLRTWWSRANKFKPVEEEAQLDVGHSYDGIRELDNATPPWFTIAFLASIVFGIGYLWRYHVLHAAPNQYQEYEIAVTKGNLKVAAYLKSKGDAVNENNVVMADAAGIEAGKQLFVNNCTACHGTAGQGGVGPNLTDDYWLHGGAIGDVFKTIKLGVVEKGMMSWKDVFSATQIAEIASYIKSIHGTNPAGAKEPQGELYKEVPATADSSAVKQPPVAADAQQ